jgi:Zn-finger domain-containing protein
MAVCKIVSHKIDIEGRDQNINLPKESQCLSVNMVDKEPFISFLVNSSQPLEQVNVINLLEGWGYSCNVFSHLNYVGVFVKDNHTFHVFTTAQVTR